MLTKKIIKQNDDNHNPILVDFRRTLLMRTDMYSLALIDRAEKNLKEKKIDTLLVRINYKNGLFSSPIVKETYFQSDACLRGRLETFLMFMNTYLVDVLKNRKQSFSFFITIGDTGTLPFDVVKELNLDTLPIMMVDIEQGLFKGPLSWVYLMPDVYLMTNNYFDKHHGKIRKMASKYPFVSRLDRAIWRGGQSGGEYNMETKDTLPRYRLVDFSYQHPDYVDARFTDHTTQVSDTQSGWDYIDFMNKRFPGTIESRTIPFKNQVRYKYIVSFDGNVSTWGRIIDALHTGSVLLYNTQFQQFFSKFLTENIHYIPVKNDTSDLIPTIDYLRNHPEICAEIVKNAEEFGSLINLELIINYYSAAFDHIAGVTKV